MEYYLYYCTEQAAQENDYTLATLIKIDGSFYYYDEDSDDWKTEVFYDASFTKDWRSKSERVKAISYDEMLKIRNEKQKRHNQDYAKLLEALEIFMSYERDRADIFKSMTYAYASLTHLWGEVFNEKEYITGALNDLLDPKDNYLISNGRYFLPPHQIKLDDEKVKKAVAIPFLCSYDTDYDKEFVWTDGGIFYNGEMINLGNGHNIVLKVTKFQVRLDGYDKKLRAYPIKTVGYWSLIYN